MELNTILHCFLDTPIQDLEVTPITSGHINSTYKVTEKEKGESYILQKINTSIFKDAKVIADNHLKINNLLKSGNYNRQIIEPVFTKQGNYLDEVEQCWRMQKFLPNSKSYEKANPTLAYKAVAAFGEFYAVINSNSSLELGNPLPGFIDFAKRVRDFHTALENASEERKEKANNEISFVLSQLSILDTWQELSVPQRIIHADPKISNVLFDNNDEVLAIIDLDTIMHGTLLYDFGDMARSYCNLTEEDNAEISENFSSEIYQSIRKAFLANLENTLTTEEKEHLDYAAKAVILVQGIRFLTDFLQGDTYYATSRAFQNLDRTINQLNLYKGLCKLVG